MINPYQITTSDQIDLIQALISDKRSIATKRAYENDLTDFFQTTTGQPANQESVKAFLSLPKTQANIIVLQYKAQLIEKGLSEATINRRLSAIKSLVTYAGKVGKCEWKLSDIQGEKIESYRDTFGVNANQISDILSIPDQTTTKGKRDYAILRLLWENALRRGEVVKTNINDYNPQELTIMIIGKGKGSQKKPISISAKVAAALDEWLKVSPKTGNDEPLFIALDNANKGHRLTGDALYYLVSGVSKQAGINKKMSPHRVRHSAITAALESTNGNVIAVKQLSRHSKLDTLMIYNDARENKQKDVSLLLSQMVKK